MLAAPASLACKEMHFTHASNDRAAVTTGIPCAMVLTAASCSPRGTGLVAPVAREIALRLDPSVGESGPHDLAVRNHIARLAMYHVHRIPHPTLRDDREAPLLGARDTLMITEIRKNERGNFDARQGLGERLESSREINVAIRGKRTSTSRQSGTLNLVAENDPELPSSTAALLATYHLSRKRPRGQCVRAAGLTWKSIEQLSGGRLEGYCIGAADITRTSEAKRSCGCAAARVRRNCRSRIRPSKALNCWA